MKHQVLLFYKYVTIQDPRVLAEHVRTLATKHSLLGRAIIAEEGINATFEGLTADTEAFATQLLKDPRLADMSIKKSAGAGKTFPKLSIKVRMQIVGTHIPHTEADPRIKTATHLKPEELRKWYEDGKEFTIVDMRNDYEYKSGHFKDSINPELENSRDLPKALPRLAPLKDKTILTVCTGGVRCESMSAYLLNKGFTDVYQLEDGIHGYMEKYPGKDFEGTLYTFDQRLVMNFGGDRAIIGTCSTCGQQSENYVNCANNACHLHFISCQNCTDSSGAAYCSEGCALVQTT